MDKQTTPPIQPPGRVDYPWTVNQTAHHGHITFNKINFLGSIYAKAQSQKPVFYINHKNNINLIYLIHNNK